MLSAQLGRAALLASFLAGCGAMAGRRASIIYNAVAAEVAPDDAIVELDRAFIERYKDQVTISTSFTVDAAKGSPSPRIFDGDLHVAGRAAEIGLRLVAEIKNADEESTAVALVNQAEVSRRPLPFMGVWRLWPEHAIGPERQGDSVPRLKTPFPDHIFEIHPLLQAGGIDLRRTLHPLEGYRPGSPAKTFDVYQNAKLTLEPRSRSVRLTISSWLYNDVHFYLQPAAPAQLAKDGRFLTARAFDKEGKLLLDSLRVVLVGDSEPERVITALPAGGRVHVWGLPRISFAEISRRLAAAGSNPAALKGSLPFEIIILGVYPNDQ